MVLQLPLSGRKLAKLTAPCLLDDLEKHYIYIYIYIYIGRERERERKEIFLNIETRTQAIKPTFIYFFLGNGIERIQDIALCPCWTPLIGQALSETGELFSVLSLSFV